MREIYPTVALGALPSTDRVLVPQPERGPGPSRVRSDGMDGIREILDAARDNGLVPGHFRGLLHIAIGRKVTRLDGTIVSSGLTWREVAALLKAMRFDRDLVREFGADPEALAPRDREKFWYTAISQARVDSPEVVAEAEQLAIRLRALGFLVGPSPSSPPPAPGPSRAPQRPVTPPAETPEEQAAKRKKKK